MYKITVVYFFLFSFSIQAQQNGFITFSDSSKQAVTILKSYKSEKEGTYYHDFIAVKNQNNEVKFFKPSEILDYQIKNRIFVKRHIKLDNGNKEIFCEQIIAEKCSLYFYKGNYSNDDDVYIFNKKNDPNFYYVKNTENRKNTSNDSQGAMYGAPTDIVLQNQVNKLIFGISNENEFENYFIRFFSDCSAIKNKIKQHWYSGFSIKALFSDCNKECL